MHLCSPLCTEGFEASRWGQNATLNSSTIKPPCGCAVLWKTRYSICLTRDCWWFQHLVEILEPKSQWQPARLSWDFLKVQSLQAMAHYTPTQPELRSSPSPIRALLRLNILKHCSLLIPSCLISRSPKGTTQDLSLSDMETLPSTHSLLLLRLMALPPESISYRSPLKLCPF